MEAELLLATVLVFEFIHVVPDAASDAAAVNFAGAVDFVVLCLRCCNIYCCES